MTATPSADALLAAMEAAARELQDARIAYASEPTLPLYVARNDAFDRLAVVCSPDNVLQLCAALRASQEREAQAVAAEREACAKIADFYQEELFRMATDTILTDRTLRGDFSDEALQQAEVKQIQGCAFSGAAHSAGDIATAIRARKDAAP